MQTGNVLSCASIVWFGVGGSGQQAWSLQYTYQTDAGGQAQNWVVVGNNLVVGPTLYSVNGIGPIQATIAALWSSPTSFVTVSPNPPGTSNPVQLPCPPIVQTAAFGLPLH